MLVTIDGQKVEAKEGWTILEAAKEAGIKIPTLCYLEEINAPGACRVCMVEVEGARSLVAACVYPVSDGMVVWTNTPKVRKARRTVVELLLANHPPECLTCVRNLNCELQNLAHEYNIWEIRYTGERAEFAIDNSSVGVLRNPNKCIKCLRCVSMCGKVITANIYTPVYRGFESVVDTAFNAPLAETDCIVCGQCIVACPTGALVDKDGTQRVWEVLADPDKYVIVQTAPSIRVTLGEEFGMKTGKIVTGKMVAALHRLGFDKVFDTDLTADLTIIEEGYEFLEKLKQGGPFPHLSSCCPGWIKFCETFFPDFLPNVSSTKSPHAMFGALAKTYHATQVGIDPAKMVVVSVMPCTAKKFEINRPEMDDSGYRDVDIVITTRELARMIREAQIDFENLPDEDFDTPLGISSGAGVIFGATGGVLEAALRTIYHALTGKEMDLIDNFKEVRGMEGVKVTEVHLPGFDPIKFAIVHGTGNARKVLEDIRKGERFYHFIEIMACPGGCVGGGGQPNISAKKLWKQTVDYRIDRADALYRIDEGLSLRRAHENPAVKKIYEEFLDKPLSDVSHQLLHTEYTHRGTNAHFKREEAEFFTDEFKRREDEFNAKEYQEP